MASTRASISKASKRLKINIIPPKQMFVDLTQDDTKTPSPKHQLSSPSAPNAPSKTPSTKDTSSSSIDYIPKSPTSSTSLSPYCYLNYQHLLLQEVQIIENNAKTLPRGGHVSKSAPLADVAADMASDLAWDHMPRGTTQVVTRGKAI
ncbi:hypothetical protein Tco_0103721 [Tanacetum coccineum]